MRKIVLALVLVAGVSAHAQQKTSNYAQQMTQSQAKDWTMRKPWDYVAGLVSKSVLKATEQYPNQEWTDSAYVWAKAYADLAINEDGTFKDFKKGNIDNIASGKVLFELYRHEAALDAKNGTHNADRYLKAADWLHTYLVLSYPRIKKGDAKGGFFHKEIYPNQMWLDGLYMGAAFYAEWLANRDPKNYSAWSDVANQFVIINNHTYNPLTGLNYHAWSADPTDENSFWARQEGAFKGCSQEYWGRGMGWFFASLIDVLEVMPKDHEDFVVLQRIAQQVAAGLKNWQDEESGCWYQLLQYDASFTSKCDAHNYLESSASSMFTYAYLKGIRIGVLPKIAYMQTAVKAYEGLIKTFISTNEDGTINLNNTCRSAGLGPAKDPSRDGTADYYLCGKDITMVSNEGKAIGPFIMASLEYETYLKEQNAPKPAPRKKVVQRRRK